jgi:O-antigen ligase
MPLLAGFILLMIFGVIVTQTRAVWLGLGLSAIILPLICAVTLLTGRYSLRRCKSARTATIGVGIFLAGLVLMMLYFIGGNIPQRLSEETVDAATITEMARLKTIPRSSSAVRIGSWSAACEWIIERPIFGWGRYGASKLIKQSPHFDEEFKSQYDHLHNSYLEALVAVGGAAVVCMVAIVLLVAWRTILAWQQGRMPTDAFLFSCVFFPFWVTVNIFESYIMQASGAFLNAVIGGFVYSWYLRGQHD